jgi:hypothetical protein
MTKTPQQIKNEVEKEIEEIREGCNKEWSDESGDYICGEDFDNPNADSGCSFFLCDNCMEKLIKAEAKLSILTEYDKSIKEMIDRLEKEYREAEIKQKGICPNVKEMTDGALIVLDRLREELLSKIGDDSDIQKGLLFNTQENKHYNSKEKGLCKCGHNQTEHISREPFLGGCSRLTEGDKFYCTCAEYEEVGGNNE